MAEDEGSDLVAWLYVVPFSLSELEELALLPPRDVLSKLSAGFSDLELVLGRLVLDLSSSEHDVQPTGRPSVTINGVGP